MQGMFAAATAIFLELQTVGIVALVLFARVVTLLALSALEVHDHTNIFFSHDYTFLDPDNTGA
jgi:hypothetical protein